jgi:hypothetical protein
MVGDDQGQRPALTDCATRRLGIPEAARPASRKTNVAVRGEHSVQLSCQELSPARPERPILIVVLGHRDDQISRVETAVVSQSLGQQRVEPLLLRTGAPATISPAG